MDSMAMCYSYSTPRLMLYKKVAGWKKLFASEFSPMHGT